MVKSPMAGLHCEEVAIPGYNSVIDVGSFVIGLIGIPPVHIYSRQLLQPIHRFLVS